LFAIVAEQMTMRTGKKVAKGTVRKRYFEWAQGLRGECRPIWENMIDRRKFPLPKEGQLDTRFIEHWKTLVEDSRRANDGSRQAHRDLLAELEQWEADPTNQSLRIDPYQKPPARTSFCSVSQQFVPEGWSYSNLMKHQPRKVNKVNAIIGPKEASNHLPFNRATRFGMRYREWIYTDDQDYDNSAVSLLNGRRDMKPQGFNTLDYLTGHFETWGVQLRRFDEDSGKVRGINQEFYVWTVLYDLIQNGFRTDEVKTTVIHELATAKGYTKKDGFGESFAEILETITQGQVVMDCSGRFDEGMFAQIFSEGIGKQSAGNFRFKASLESAFHRIRTQSSGLLGNVGNRYQVTPEHNARIDRYTKTILSAIDDLPVEERQAVFDLVRFPKHTWEEFTQLLNYVYAAVNQRTDHKLEGWGRCGFILPGWSVKNPLHPNSPPALYTREDFLALDPEAQQYIQAKGKDHDIVLSPAQAVEICRRTDPNIAYLDLEAASDALPLKWAYGNRNGRKNGIKVEKSGEFVIRDPERFGQDSIYYFATAHLNGDQIPLRPGDRYLIQICPFDPDKAILLTMEGRFRGIIHENRRPRASDLAARLRTQGKINEFRANVTRSGERRHRHQVDELREDLDHNERVLSGEITPDETTLHHERKRHQQNQRDEAAENGVVTVDLAPDPQGEHDDDLDFDSAFLNNPDLDTE
ncbi:MAG: hypothetical protein AAF491_09045, partial [Verrucomicrobiota bacterium]